MISMKLSVELSKVIISIPIEKGLDEDEILLRYKAEVFEAIAQALTEDHIDDITVMQGVFE